MNLFQKFASVGVATLASRFLGFFREALIAALLGAGPVADAFYAAFRFPNLFRRLFAEGAFNSAFVPLFAKELEGGGRQAAREFAEQILSVMVFVLLIISAIAMIFMPFLVGHVIAPKFAEDPDKFDLTVKLTRIMFPYLAFMSLVAMFSGILNSFRRYFLPAIAPVILNIIFIFVLIIGGLSGLSDANLGIAMAWGVMLAGFAQLVLLIVGVWREGFYLSLRMPKMSPAVKHLLVLAVPTAIANGITQINLLVGQIIASAQSGAIAVMNYADRLMQLPLGIVGISIGIVLLPELTRALTAKNFDEANDLQNKSLEFGLALTLPAAVGLFMMPLPLVSLVYERGAFDRETAQLTANVLAAFAVGLPSFVLIKIFQPSYYARQDMRTPMWFSGANAIINIVLSLVLFPFYGPIGLGIATSVAGWVNAIFLALSLGKGGHYKIASTTYKNIGLIIFACLVMGCTLYGAQAFLGHLLIDTWLWIRIIAVLGVIAVAAFIYFAIIIASGAVSKDQLKRLLKRS